MTRSDQHSRLIALACLAFIAFNYPILFLFGKGIILWGVPLLFWYLLFTWIAIIGLTAWIVHRPIRKISDRE